MFYYLQGPIAILEPGMAVVDCGGVGYACSVTAYTAAQLKLNQTARLYIHENIREKISVDELVALVPLSRRLLETRFKKSMGTSIYDYIIQTRIEKVAQFLCEGMSVSEAALELGFSDIKNLSRMFRQLRGMTPSEYRRHVLHPER